MSLAGAAPFVVAAYTLDEASGTRADSVGSRKLTDNNTVGSGTGKFGICANFVDSNTEYFYTSFTPPSGNTWCISLWIKTTANNRQICGWDNNNSGTSGTFDRWLYLDSGGIRQPWTTAWRRTPTTTTGFRQLFPAACWGRFRIWFRRRRPSGRGCP